MITDTIENLSIYKTIFPEISDLLNTKEFNDLDSLSEKTAINNVTLIPIYSKEISDSFNSKLLESHKKLMDIHITLSGIDVIAYANLNTEVQEFKSYSDVDDYALHTSDKIKEITVPAGYFCIIPNNFAHMALYQAHSEVKKVVVKLQVIK